MNEPRNTQHLDYMYLKSNAGPMYRSPRDEEERQELVKKGVKKHVTMFSIEKKSRGGVRMCQRCLKAKPDRCHHCSQCNRCILKMDHHCPWVGNCIGFHNYKYFLCLLFYCAVTCQLIIYSSNPLFKAALARDDIPYKMAFFIATAYVLACVFGTIITIFFCFHLYLISGGLTTIEFCEKSGRKDLFKLGSPYDVGIYANFQNTLGDNPLLWLLPCNRNLEGEGLYFQVKPELLAESSN